MGSDAGFISTPDVLTISLPMWFLNSYISVREGWSVGVVVGGGVTVRSKNTNMLKWKVVN